MSCSCHVRLGRVGVLLRGDIDLWFSLVAPSITDPYVGALHVNQRHRRQKLELVLQARRAAHMELLGSYPGSQPVFDPVLGGWVPADRVQRSHRAGMRTLSRGPAGNRQLPAASKLPSPSAVHSPAGPAPSGSPTSISSHNQVHDKHKAHDGSHDRRRPHQWRLDMQFEAGLNVMRTHPQVSIPAPLRVRCRRLTWSSRGSACSLGSSPRIRASPARSLRVERVIQDG